MNERSAYGTIIGAFCDQFDAVTFFNKVMDLFFKLPIFFVVMVLAMGLVRLF
jgi:hypothetical protein